MVKVSNRKEGYERSEAQEAILEAVKNKANELEVSLREQNIYPTYEVVKGLNGVTEQKDCVITCDTFEVNGKAFGNLIIQSGNDQLKIGYNPEADRFTSASYKEDVFVGGKFNKDAEWKSIRDVENAKAELVAVAENIDIQQFTKGTKEFSEKDNQAFGLYREVKNMLFENDKEVNDEGKRNYWIGDYETFTKNNGNTGHSFDLCGRNDAKLTFVLDGEAITSIKYTEFKGEGVKPFVQVAKDANEMETLARVCKDEGLVTRCNDILNVAVSKEVSQEQDISDGFEPVEEDIEEEMPFE